MSIELKFNDNSSQWERDLIWNTIFVETQVRYSKDLYKMKGYLYLNTIYEQFGLKWNPYDKNTCWIYDRDGEINIEWLLDEPAREITIRISMQ